jgi:phage tail P2-like protein
MMRLNNVVSRKLMPLFMRSDSFDVSISEGLDEIVKDMDERINQNLRFWDNFDNMTEEQLDEAAEELKVHWYRYDVNVEMKREIIKKAKYIKRKIGTPYAIEEVLRIYFCDATLVEWWEYGGTRNHFKIQTYNSDTINSDAAQFLSILDKIKRKKAVLDYVEVMDYGTNELKYVIKVHSVEKIARTMIGGM